MVTLFVIVCLAGHCAPEVAIPVSFDDQAACTTFVDDALAAWPAVGRDVTLLFRCAAET